MNKATQETVWVRQAPILRLECQSGPAFTLGYRFHHTLTALNTTMCKYRKILNAFLRHEMAPVLFPFCNQTQRHAALELRGSGSVGHPAAASQMPHLASAGTRQSFSSLLLMPYSNPAAVPPHARLVREQAHWGCRALPANGQNGHVKIKST